MHEEPSLPVPDDVPTPILLNTYKHSLTSLQALVADAVAFGSGVLPMLAETLLVLGENLMDLYIGELSPEEIATKTLRKIDANGLVERKSFAEWVEESGGYRVVELEESDQSRWVLRLSEVEERFVHIHPGRWSPQTLRVRAHTLKSAVMAVVDALLHGREPFDVKRINELRVEFLGLSPIREVTPRNGLGKMMTYFLDKRGI